MQGLKVKFDERSIVDLKQNFDNLIKELENKSTININFNQDAFKNINNQIDEINNKLSQVGNKVRDNIKINVTTNADLEKLNNELNSEIKIIKDFAKKAGLSYNDELKKNITEGMKDISNIPKVLEKLEEESLNNANKLFKKKYIDERKKELKDFRQYFENNVYGINPMEYDKDELKKIQDNFYGLVKFKKNNATLPTMEANMGEIADQLKMPFLKDMVHQDAVKYLSNINAEYKNLKNLNIGEDEKNQEIIIKRLNKDFDEMIYKLEQLKQVKNDVANGVNKSSKNSSLYKQKEEIKETETILDRIQKKYKNIGEEVKIKTPFNVNANKQELTEYAKAVAGLKAEWTKCTPSIDSAGNKIREVNVRTREGGKYWHNYSMILDESTGKIYKVDKGLSDLQNRQLGLAEKIKVATQSFFVWMNVTNMFYQGVHKLKEGIQFTNDLNKMQTNIQMITGMDRGKIQGVTKDFSELAGQLHSTTKETIMGAESFLRAGKSIEETRNLLQSATIGGKISGQETNEVSEQLIAIANGYKINISEGKKVMEIVDKLSTVDNNASTSFRELATAMRYTSSTAQSVNVEMPNLISYIGTISSVSRKSAESIGNSVRTIFTRYQNIREGKKFDPDNEPLSNVEKSLNRVGIAIRKDKTHFKDFNTVLEDISKKWKGFNDIQKSTVVASLGGTRQGENLRILLDNMEQVHFLQEKMSESAGSAENKFKSAYGDSTEAKVNDLKHSVEELYQTLIHSEPINKFVSGITNIIKTLSILTTTSKKSGLALIGLSTTMILLIKHFGTLASLLKSANLVGVMSFFSGSISSLSTAITGLATNPLGLLVIALGVATTAVVKHISKQKKLKEDTDNLSKSYKSLTQAINENNVAEMKSGIKGTEAKQKELKNLLEQRKKLEKNLEKNPQGTGMGRVITNKLNKVNEQIKAFEKAGFTINEVTGRIVELDQAQAQLLNNETVERINKEKEATLKHKDELISLIEEYQHLDSQSNKNATTKERISQITKQLNTEIKELVVVTDKDGNSQIKNTDILNNKIKIINQEKDAIITKYNVIMENSKKEAIIEQNGVTMTYNSVKLRIDAIKKEIEALNELIMAKGKAFNPQANEDDSYTASLYLKNKKYKENQVSDLESIINKVDELYKTADSSAKGLKDSMGYIPPETEKTTKSTKKNTEATKQNSEAVNKAKEAVKAYENALKSLQMQMAKVNIELGHYNEHSDEYVNKLKEKKGLIQDEINLRKQQIGINKELASSLGEVGQSYSSGVGATVGQDIVNKASKYLGTKYVYGGTSPNGFDCSGLVQYVYNQVGVSLNRTSQQQFKQGTPISKKDLQTGDLVFFKGSNGSTSAPGHVAIYAGNGQIIEAPRTGDVVKYSSLANRGGYVGARRITSGSGYSNRGVSGYSGKYSSYINEASKKYGVSPALIASVIEAESSFNPNSKSSAGAMGLMQLMPSTARGLGVKNAYDPYQNIMGGAKELANLSKQYNGNLDLILAGYNAGVGAVQKHGGVPSFTQNYISKVKNNMGKYGASEGSIHSVINEEMDLLGKATDMERENLELQEELHKINIEILNAKIGQFDDKAKFIDTRINQFRVDTEIAGRNDTVFVNYLREIEKETTNKYKLLTDERKYIQSMIDSGNYDSKTIEVMKQKLHDLGTEMLNIRKNLKDIGYEVANAKWEAMQSLYISNMEMINNEIERLSTNEEKNLTKIMHLRKQTIEQDEMNIKRITELIREMNKEEAKYDRQFLFDKIQEYNKELDKANTALVQHRKELENVKKNMNNLINTIEDKIKELLTKQAELAKGHIDKVVKYDIDKIDEAIKKLDEAERRNSYSEQKTEQLNKIKDLQAKIAKLSLANDQESIARRSEYERQLKEEMSKKDDMQMKHSNELRKQQLQDMKKDREKEAEDKKKAIDTETENLYMNLKVRKTLQDGYITDINGKRVELEQALLNYTDIFGQGVLSIGEQIKKEIIEQLHSANALLKEVKDIAKPEFKNTKNVYGTGVDLENAKTILGIEGYSYIDTKMVDTNSIKLGKNDIVLGGKGIPHGINRTDLNGATRLAGEDRYETSEILKLYKDIADGKITPTNGVVYGSGTDLLNAMKWLSPLGYEFVDTSKINPKDIKFNQNDLIVGGKGAKGGVNFDVNGVKRLGGQNRFNTDEAIRNHALSTMRNNIGDKYMPNKGVVYGNGIDLENAKKHFSKYGYNFVKTNSVADVDLTRDDIIVGGQMQGKDRIYNSGAKWLWGKDRKETERIMSEYTNYIKKLPAFKTGGIMDKTGLSILHGKTNAVETVFNATQGKKLYDFVNNLPINNSTVDLGKIAQTQISSLGLDKILNRMSVLSSDNSIKSDVNVNLNIEKFMGTKDEANYFGKLIGDIASGQILVNGKKRGKVLTEN